MAALFLGRKLVFEVHGGGGAGLDHHLHQLEETSPGVRDARAVMTGGHFTLLSAEPFAMAASFAAASFLIGICAAIPPELLGHHYTASWEQVSHRLTTMRKPGATGVPFHFVCVAISR